MSRPLGGRLHLWLWVTAGVVLYVISCPPIEAWHDKQHGDARYLKRPPPGPAPGGHFEIVEVGFVEPVPRPEWMQYLYAPVHVMESYPPFDGLFQKYRQWCEGVL